MMDRKELKATLSEGLTVGIDGILGDQGFVRRKNSLAYVRTADAAVQTVKFRFDMRPSYQPNADAHLIPSVTVVMEELNRLALEMTDGRADLIGNSDLTISQPFDIAIPKEEHIRWFIQGADTVVPCLQSVAESMRVWTIPFLNDYTTPEAVAKGYECNDDRVLKQRHFYIYVAASFVLSGEPQKAMQVLEKHFGRTTPRRTYSSAFEYVAARLS